MLDFSSHSYQRTSDLVEAMSAQGYGQMCQGCMADRSYYQQVVHMFDLAGCCSPGKAAAVAVAYWSGLAAAMSASGTDFDSSLGPGRIVVLVPAGKEELALVSPNSAGEEQQAATEIEALQTCGPSSP